MGRFTVMKYAPSFLVIFIISPLAFAFSFSGNLKSYPIIRDLPAATETQKAWQNSFKFQAQQSFSDVSKSEAAYEMTATFQKHLPHTTSEPAYRFTDINTYVHDEHNYKDYKTSVVQNLNRLNVSYSFSFADFNLGRQPMNFGAAKSINPTDVLTPFSINTIDKEERFGVDAFVVKVPIEEFSIVEFGTIAGKDFTYEKSAYYVRPKFNIEKFEINLTALKFKKRDLLGFDIQHPISDAGSWLEVAYVDEPENKIKDFLRLTTGVDYKFKNSLYLSGEYHYNGASTGTKRLNGEDFIFLRDKHYAIGTASYELTPLLIGTLQTYFNSKDNSAFSNLKFDYNYTDNIYFSLGNYAGLGNSKTTEFGAYGKTYYLSLRYYF